LKIRSLTGKTRDAQLEEIVSLGEDKSIAMSEKLRAELTAYRKWMRNWPLINCWHMNEYESVAMWNLYSKAKEAIAIVSTYTRLRECLNENFWIEEVQHIDYDRDTIPPGNALYPSSLSAVHLLMSGS
jgi:hypothetical protein